MALQVKEPAVSPEEARRRLQYLQVKLWFDQYSVNWFIRDIRSDVYLKNELTAFWEGRVTEIHSWADPFWNTAKKIGVQMPDLLTQFWENTLKPGIQSLLAGLGWIAERARDLVMGSLKTAVQPGNWLWQTLADVTAPIRNALADVWTYLVETVSGALETLGKGLAALPQAIAGAFQAAISWIADVIKGVGSKVVEFFTWLGKATYDALMGGLQWLWNLLNNAVSSFLNWVVSQCTAISSALKRGEWELALLIAAAWTAIGAGACVLPDIASLKVIGSGLDLKAVGSYLARLFDPRIITGATIGVITYAAITEPTRQFFLKLFRPIIPDEHTAMQMYWRGILDEEGYKEVLRRRGYDDKYIEGFLELSQVIPGISDLIRFAVREAYPVATTEEQWRELERWAAKQGLSKYWVGRYVEAHWVLPGFEALREAFWRGIIDAEDFKKFIVKHDYRPTPWPGHRKSDLDIMFELSYNLPGAIEQRWMLRWGLLDKATLKDLTAKRGLHPDWVEPVTEAIIRQTLTDERTRLLTQLRILYREGQLSVDEFLARLKTLYYSDAEIALIKEAADLERQRVVTEEAMVRYREASRADYARAYRMGLLSEAEFRLALERLRYPPDVVDLIIRLENTLKEAELEKERKREIAELERRTRELSRADLSRCFQLGLITEEAYKGYLESLGYSEADAQRIIELDKAKAALALESERLRKEQRKAIEAARLTADEKNSVKTALQSLYVHGLLDVETFKARLKALEWTDEEITLTVEAADLQIQKTLLEKRVDAAVLEYRYGKISLEQLSQKLNEIGLSPAFIQNVLLYEASRTKLPVASTPEEEVRAMGSSVALKRFREGLTTPEDLEQELRLLGYSPAEIARYRIIAELERDYNVCQEALSALRTAYRKGKITETKFLELAEAFGVLRDYARLLLDLEKLKLGIGLTEAA